MLNADAIWNFQGLQFKQFIVDLFFFLLINTYNTNFFLKLKLWKFFKKILF